MFIHKKKPPGLIFCPTNASLLLAFSALHLVGGMYSARPLRSQVGPD